MDCQTVNLRKLKCAHLAISAGYNGWKQGAVGSKSYGVGYCFHGIEFNCGGSGMCPGKHPALQRISMVELVCTVLAQESMTGQIISPNNGMLI